MFLKFPFKSFDCLKSLTDCGREFHNTADAIDCKTVGFFLFSKSVKKSVKHSLRVLREQNARASHALRACGVCVSPQSRSLFSALFRAFCLTARAYLNTQK